MARIHPAGRGVRILAIAAFAWGLAGSVPAGEPAHKRGVQPSARGRELFLREWVPRDPRGHGGDGLGPLYNETSCVACHNQGAPGGAGEASKNVEIVTLRAPLPAETKARLGEYHPGFRTSASVLLHRYGTESDYTLWRLRRVCGVEFADMVERGGDRELDHLRNFLGVAINTIPPSPLGRFTPSQRLLRGSGALGVKGTLLLLEVATSSRRNALPLFGVGLIDAIPAEVIVAAASDSEGSLGGRVSRLKDGRIGRFGWKAQTASLKDFVESACAMEIGLEVPTHHQAPSPIDPADDSNSRGLDMTQDECDALTAFVASLPAPIERDAGPGPNAQPDGAAGRALFRRIGCAGCHLPSLGPVEGIYSDLLLHDMGDLLSDAGGYYGVIESASPTTVRAQEWRTPPLWGFRDSAPYLHDGRAENLLEVIAFHGGQGESSARNFFALTPRERLQVQTFLNTLSAPKPYKL